jgi:hypothetical protein
MSFTVRIWLDRVCLPVSAIPKQATLSKSGPVQPLTQTRPCPCLQFSNRQLHLNRAATEYKLVQIVNTSDSSKKAVDGASWGPVQPLTQTRPIRRKLLMVLLAL